MEVQMIDRFVLYAESFFSEIELIKCHLSHPVLYFIVDALKFDDDLVEVFLVEEVSCKDVLIGGLSIPSAVQ